MKFASERNPVVIGVVGIAVTAGVATAALQYDKLPFLLRDTGYAAYFTEAGGILPGAPVQVSGYQVGEVSDVRLDGQRVLVSFRVSEDILLGERTEASIETDSLLGAKVMQITPLGEGELDGPIPAERTRPPYQLPDALGDLTTAVSGIDTGQLSDSLAVLAESFADTPPALRMAVQGVTRFTETLNNRDAELRNLLSNANKATTVLADRTDQVVDLIGYTNSLLDQLRSQSRALDQISGNISAVAQQITGLIGEQRHALKPALEKLNGVLAIVENRKDRVKQAVKGLNDYVMSLGESVSSGPFFKAYLANLLPGQFVQPFIDSAFSDLGLDPNVLLPSERADPQTGQVATPALPVPYPRTGQGGPPRTTLPDAITGNPGDPRYPYREPPPAPPPGGPPPGPPALPPTSGEATP
ncbi:MCE family protein [Mycolicibacterium phlei]